MATSAIGVRDLKEHVTALVRRASRGERVIITRYGRPCAVLGPVAEASGDIAAAPRGARMAAWEVERRAFEGLRPRLGRRYDGNYVAVLGGRVVGWDADAGRLYERVWKKARGRTFFIGRVGGAAQVIDMPGFEIE